MVPDPNANEVCADYDKALIALDLLAGRVNARDAQIATQVQTILDLSAQIDARDARIERLTDAMKELLRLYDWRFELAKEEEDLAQDRLPRTEQQAVRIARRRLNLESNLRKYGREKAAAWIAARKEIAEMEGK